GQRFVVVERRQDQDRRRIGIFSYQSSGFDPVDSFHPEVHHDDIGGPRGQRVGQLVAVAAFGDDVESVASSQDPPQAGAYELLIVDQYDGDRCIGGRHCTNLRPGLSRFSSWSSVPDAPTGTTRSTTHSSPSGPTRQRPPSCSARDVIPATPLPSCWCEPEESTRRLRATRRTSSSATSRRSVTRSADACLATFASDSWATR